MQKEKLRERNECSGVNEKVCGIHGDQRRSKKASSLESITTIHPALDEQEAESVRNMIEELPD